MKRWTIWLPFALFGLFFVVVVVGLAKPDDRIITSKMIGKPLPAFDLPAGVADRPALSRADFADGKPKLLNIFASWCVPCIAEAPYLKALADRGVEVNGVAIRDTREDLTAFLERNGNPYTRIGSDKISKIQFDLGSSGVPETFVIDGKGKIVYQHIGDIRAKDVPRLVAMVEDAPR